MQVHAETPLSTLRVGVWDDRREDNLVAQREIQNLPHELVHYLLGCALLATGGTVDWLGGTTTVRFNFVVEIGDPEIPF